MSSVSKSSEKPDIKELHPPFVVPMPTRDGSTLTKRKSRSPCETAKGHDDQVVTEQTPDNAIVSEEHSDDSSVAKDSPGHPHSDNKNPSSTRDLNSQKNTAHGLLNVTLLAANASQLRVVLKHGDSYNFYQILVALISISIILQLIVAVTMVWLGVMDTDRIFARTNERRKRHIIKINAVVTVIIVFIMAINVFISGFGLPGKDDK